RQRRQPVLELRCRRPDSRQRRQRAARPPVPRDAGHAAALVRHAAATRRRRDGPDPARQQQRLLPGQRDLLVRRDAADMGLREYTARLIGVRREHPVFRRQKYLTGAEAAELGWYSPAGTPMTGRQWADQKAHVVAVYLDGADAPDEAAGGTLMVDDDFLVLVNAWRGPVTFTVPEVRPGAPTAQSWFTELDSYDPAVPALAEAQRPRHAGDQLVVRPRSLTVLRA